MAAKTLDPEYFIAWRKRQGLTQQDIATVLDVNISAVKKWETRARKLPSYIGYVMAAIEAGLEPVGKDHMIEVAGASADE